MKHIARKKKSGMRKKISIRRPKAKRSMVNGGKLFNQGYDVGYNKGHEEGYRQGNYDGEGHNEWKNGVEGIIDSLLPNYEILPEITAEQVIAAGVEQLRPHIVQLLSAEQLGDRILQALDTRTPFSVVRLGDGELLTLAQGVVLSIEQVKKEGHFLGYAGVNVPDYEARDRLMESVRHATVVGIPKLRVRNFMRLAISVFHAHGVDYRSLTLTDSLVNYYLYQAGYLSRVLAGRRILVVGDHAGDLAKFLENHGHTIAGAIHPVNGVNDVSRVMGEVQGRDFDIAVIAAGIPAVMISQRIASELGKVAIDFGHLADAMIKGEAPYK